METYTRIISVLICYLTLPTNAAETVLSSVLKPEAKKTSSVQRTARSYYDPRLYAYPVYPSRPLYERLEDDRPRCGRCMEDRYDEDYDRRRPYDDDRRSYERRPTYNRYDTSKYDRNDRNRDEDYTDRRPSERKNGTKGSESSETKDDKKMYDDKDGDRRGNPNRSRDRNRYDERDRVRPDYNDRERYYRDPYRERNPYEERRPYDRYYDEAYPGRGVEGFGYRRPAYDDGFDRGNGYDDAGYGSYSPSAGRGPHDRPWDETYRGTSGFDAGGRGYYFAGGRPDPGAGGWERLEYDRPTAGWQDVGYPAAYRDPYERGVAAYQDPYRQDPYRQDPYRQEVTPYRPSGWHSVNERKPSQQGNGVYRQPSRNDQNGGSYGNSGAYGQSGGAYGQNGGAYGQNGGAYGQNGGAYGQNGGAYGQNGGAYGQGGSGTYGQTSNRGQTSSNNNINNPTSTSTTPGNSYLYDRDDNMSSIADSDSTTKTPS